MEDKDSEFIDKINHERSTAIYDNAFKENLDNVMKYVNLVYASAIKNGMNETHAIYLSNTYFREFCFKGDNDNKDEGGETNEV